MKYVLELTIHQLDCKPESPVMSLRVDCKTVNEVRSYYYRYYEFLKSELGKDEIICCIIHREEEGE